MILWTRISTLERQKRYAILLSHMTDIARKVCLTVGNNHIGNTGGAGHISRIHRERFAPDAIDRIYQDFERPDRNMETYLLEFYAMRLEAEARMVMGIGFPDEFAPVLLRAKCFITQKWKFTGVGQHP